MEEIDGSVVETEKLDVETGRKDGSDQAGDEVRGEKGGDRGNVFELEENSVSASQSQGVARDNVQ